MIGIPHVDVIIEIIYNVTSVISVVINTCTIYLEMLHQDSLD